MDKNEEKMTQMCQKDEKNDINLSNNPIIIGRFKEFLRRDFIYIIVCLFAVLACLYTIYTVSDYQQQCNEYWLQQWEESGCFQQPDTFNESFILPWSDNSEGGITNENQDNDNNPQGTGKGY